MCANKQLNEPMLINPNFCLHIENQCRADCLLEAHLALNTSLDMIDKEGQALNGGL